MTPKFVAFILYVLASLMSISLSYADRQPDYEREARLADQIVDDIFDGEAVWLEANDHQFLAIHTLNEEAPKGTVIILHGRGFHPDWPDVAGPLRVGLVEQGWSTLSVQMPVLEKGKKYYDYIPIFDYAHERIESAIRFAESQSDKAIILAAHSCGAHMANDWLNHTNKSSLDGYIIMGAGTTDYRQNLRTPFPFAKLKIPILDLYGEFEFPRPLAMLPQRQRLLSSGGHPDSSQQSLPQADHYFHDVGDELTEVIAEWLNTTDFTPKR